MRFAARFDWKMRRREFWNPCYEERISRGERETEKFATEKERAPRNDWGARGLLRRRRKLMLTNFGTSEWHRRSRAEVERADGDGIAHRKARSIADAVIVRGSRGRGDGSVEFGDFRGGAAEEGRQRLYGDAYRGTDGRNTCSHARESEVDEIHGGAGQCSASGSGEARNANSYRLAGTENRGVVRAREGCSVGRDDETFTVDAKRGAGGEIDVDRCSKRQIRSDQAA